MELIPPFDPSFFSESRAEQKVASLLARIDRADATAFHSVHLPRHERQQMGEIDFVVLWGGVVVCLEVKGGRLSRVNGRWYQTGRRGTHPMRRSPFDQAREARFAFSKNIEANLGERYCYGYALVTPDCSLSDALEVGDHEYLGSSDMTVLGVENRLDLIAKRALSSRPRSIPRRDFSDLTALRRSLRKDLDGAMTLVQQAEFIEHRRVELLDEQIDFLESARFNPRVVLEGGAGTGKTLVGLHGAKNEAAEGRNTAFVVQTEESRTRAEGAIRGDGPTIVLADELPLAERVDLIVVDEAQDLMNPQDLDRVFASVRGGADDGRWWMLLDPNHQAHVSGTFDQDSLDLVVHHSGSTRIRLTRNVRNTDQVIQAVQLYLGADLGSRRIGDGPPVQVIEARDEEDVVSRLRAHISLLREQGATSGQMAIVSAAGSAENRLARGSDLLGTQLDKVRVWTPQQIKGIEFRHVMVVGSEDLTDRVNANRVYVAITRPSTSLLIVVPPDRYKQLLALARKRIRQRDGDR